MILCSTSQIVLQAFSQYPEKISKINKLQGLIRAFTVAHIKCTTFKEFSLMRQ